MIELNAEVRLSAVVMTHPKRRANTEALCAAHPELGIRVVTDPDPGGEPTSVRTATLAWHGADPDATHHLVIEDDAELIEDFATQVQSAVRAQPAAVVCLHTASTSRTSFSARLAIMAGTPWAPVVGDYVPSVATVLPRALAMGFGDHIADRAVLSDHHDELLKRYLDDVDIPRLVTVPNLADHLPFPSLEGNVTPDGRRSMCFVKSGVDADWTRPPVDPPVVPYLSPDPYRHAVGFVGARAGARTGIRPAIQVLLERDVRLEMVTGRFLSSQEKWASAVPDLRDTLFELWCTAALLGAAHRMATPLGEAPRSLDEVLGDPLFQTSIDAWADGLADRRVPAEERPSASKALAHFLVEGVVAGDAAVGASSTDAFTASR